MNAAVSGRAGLALLSTDEGLATVHVSEPERVFLRSAGEVRQLLQSYGDFDFLEDVGLEEVRQELRSAWEANEGLDLALIMLDSQLSIGVRTRAMEALDALVAENHVAEHLRRTLYASPLPPDAASGFALSTSVTRGYSRLAHLLSELIRDQDHIKQVREAFEAIYAGESGNLHSRLSVLARSGVFVKMVRWLSSGAPNRSVTEFLGEVDSRVVDRAEVETLVERWVAELGSPPRIQPEERESETAVSSSPSISVLICDDEELLVKSCGQILSSEGYTVFREGRGKNALENVRRHRPDVVLTDLMLPDMDGLTLLKEIKKLAPETLVVMITGFATVDSSVEAIRAGVYDYIPKPFTATQLRILIGRAAQQVQLVRDNAHLRDQLKKHYSFENIIGTSESIQKVFSVVSRVAPTDSSVFISGESGTGKELVARAIHANSRRSARPFIAINCAALPDNLLESELFGREKEGFTAAGPQPRGLLEVASGGNFFLDEISEMSLDLQAKLLRVIQERRIRRVGGESEIPIDVRWVAATDRDPEQAVRYGNLRQDLLYRLNVVPVKLPPLRMRREDIPALAQRFLRKYGQEYERGNLRFSQDALRVLSDYQWPGNIRELQNMVERIVPLCVPGQEITPEDLPEDVIMHRVGTRASVTSPADLPFRDAVTLFEKEYLRDLLRRHNGNISQAARTARIDRETMNRMLTKYGFSEFEEG